MKRVGKIRKIKAVLINNDRLIMSIFKKITFTCLVGCATSFYTSHAMEEKSPMDVEETSNVGSTHSLDYKQMETALEQEFSQMDFGGNQKNSHQLK